MHKITEHFLRPYSQKQVSLLQSMAVEMETFGLTASDVLSMAYEFFAELKATMQVPPTPAKTEKSPPHLCPSCGSTVTISAVNISRCTNIGGSWKSVSICDNPACVYSELSEKTVADIKVAK